MIKSVSAEEARRILGEKGDDKNFSIIDIRTEREFESGHLPNASNLDFYNPAFYGELGKLDKEKAYFIYCRSGSRTKGALEMMENLGFKEVYELDGGIISLG